MRREDEGRRLGRREQARREVRAETKAPSCLRVSRTQLQSPWEKVWCRRGQAEGLTEKKGQAENEAVQYALPPRTTRGAASIPTPCSRP